MNAKPSDGTVALAVRMLHGADDEADAEHWASLSPAERDAATREARASIERTARSLRRHRSRTR